MATTAQLLTEAQSAYHKLMTGTAVAEVQDSNGERVRYTAADLSKLKAYIADLKAQIATASGTGVPSGPMRVWL